MPLLGAHLSIAGGYFKAANAAGALGMDTVQIFTKNNNQWRAKPLTDEDVTRFREAIGEHDLSHPCSHASYLINLASPKDELWEKSIEAFIVELRRADALGLDGVVLHPGSYTESSEEEGLARIVAALDRVHAETADLSAETWLEGTAGQGTNLGNRFEHLATIRDGVKEPDRIGICLDTCHLFSAGYSLREPEEYAETISEFDRVVGLDSLRCFHLNDSKTPFASRKDRHEHIGLGTLGLEPFRHIVNDDRFADLPMYMETPKSKHPEGDTADPINLKALRDLIA